MKFFDNAQVFGFTGTPIFTENAVDGHTTKEIFGNNECRAARDKWLNAKKGKEDRL